MPSGSSSSGGSVAALAAVGVGAYLLLRGRGGGLGGGLGGAARRVDQALPSDTTESTGSDPGTASKDDPAAPSMSPSSTEPNQARTVTTESGATAIIDEQGQVIAAMSPGETVGYETPEGQNVLESGDPGKVSPPVVSGAGGTSGASSGPSAGGGEGESVEVGSTTEETRRNVEEQTASDSGSSEDPALSGGSGL